VKPEHRAPAHDLAFRRHGPVQDVRDKQGRGPTVADGSGIPWSVNPAALEGRANGSVAVQYDQAPRRRGRGLPVPGWQAAHDDPAVHEHQSRRQPDATGAASADRCLGDVGEESAVPTRADLDDRCARALQVLRIVEVAHQDVAAVQATLAARHYYDAV